MSVLGTPAQQARRDYSSHRASSSLTITTSPPTTLAAAPTPAPTLTPLPRTTMMPQTREQERRDKEGQTKGRPQQGESQRATPSDPNAPQCASNKAPRPATSPPGPSRAPRSPAQRTTL
ncbi:hypothetical protein H0H92_001240 [Tricholoma furcatifolium]|nr:hypothetical protein H0H92_001240 [Tricholoma furcatifolium]